MVMSDKLPRWLLWIGGIVLVWMFIYGIRGALLPFVLGLAIAYLLDPAVDRLEKFKLPRWLATTLTLVLFFAGISSVGFLLAPILSDQVQGIVRSLPGYIERVRPFVMNLVENSGQGAEAQKFVNEAGAKAFSFISDRLGSVLAGSLQLFHVVTLLLISPVVAFYILRDWDGLIAKLDSWLPRDQEPVIKKLLGDSDRALGGFIRGQITLCLVIGAIYAICWSLLGLQYGLLLGILTGILAFVPSVGQLLGTVLAVTIAISQYGGNVPQIALVAGVYVFAQILETAFLIPKLVGEKVGLHPVWVLFAVFAGGELMGMVGIFIAVPVAAVLAVLARWGVDQYLASRYYDDDANSALPVKEDDPVGEASA
jgi:predicted PurR-regulated permease PerM